MQNQKSTTKITRININNFKLKQKAVVCSGPCQISDDQSSIILKINATQLKLKKSQKLARLKQVNYTTYFLCHESGIIYTISIRNEDYLSIQKFQEIVTKHIEIIDFLSLPQDSEMRQKIFIETPIDQSNPGEFGSNNDDKLELIGKGLGSAIGGISSIFDTDKMNRQSDKFVTKVSKDTFSNKTLSAWQSFKNKCSEVNDSLSTVMKPLSDVCKSTVGDIGSSFNNSSNTFIKGVRQYSKKTQKALNQGYGKADAPRRASYIPPNEQQPGSQSSQSSQSGLQGLQVTHPVSLQQPMSRQDSGPRVISFSVQDSSKNSNQRKSLL